MAAAFTPLHRQENKGREIPSREFVTAAVRLNVVIAAIGGGLAGGMFMFLVTHLSLLVTGDQAGRYLNLLGVFMPGYVASAEGAWIGLLWGAAYGSISCGLLAWLYARTAGDRVVDLTLFRDDSRADLRPPVLLLSPHSIGLALGSVMGLQLFLTTTWLVIRGTAGESPHASLLSNYLPGYTPSLAGGLIGAAELFVLVYASAFLVGTIYNRIARYRHHRDRRPRG